MAAPETRHVNQCTYTPIVRDPQNDPFAASFTPPQPSLKLAIIGTVYDDPNLHQFIFEIPGREGQPPLDPRLMEATRQMWAGDIAGAARVINDLEIPTVLEFAQHSLDRHVALLQDVEKDVDRALASAATKAALDHEGQAQLKSATVELRDSARTSAAANMTLGTAESFRAGAASPEPLSTQTAELPVVSHEQVQAELSHISQRTAEFLGKTRFFEFSKPTALPLVAETRNLITYTAIQQYLAEQKRRAIQAMSVLGGIEPVGYLHLERLSFTPVGYHRGELVYSLPMLPGETVRLSHREWTRTETEYTELVATSLETAKQDALSEKSELTESVTTQQQHSSAFNSSVTASGGFGPVHVSSGVSYGVQSAESSSRTTSAKHSQEITKTASSRAKQEHKITFRVSTQYEVEEQSFREITNLRDQAVRWDYYRLMEKWQIDLYRYDVRLTYDIVIPEPASYLLRKYILLANLQALAAQPFALQVTPQNITGDNFRDLATKYNASLDPPPLTYQTAFGYAEQTYSTQVVGADFVTITLPDGYEFDYVSPVISAEGSTIQTDEHPPRKIGKADVEESHNINVLRGGAWQSQSYLWRYTYDWSEAVEPEKGDVLAVAITLRGKLLNQTLFQWQMQCYQRLLDGAKSQYEAAQQQLAKEIEALTSELGREDVLTLRKLEKEEIMKGVLRWMLGPSFNFYPPDLPSLGLSNADLAVYDPNTQAVASNDADNSTYKAVLAHGDIIRFLHHAIEWENVNYVLYPYIWTSVDRWDLKQSLFHADYEHRSFLRAGAARVVLTIRPDYEKAFLSFIKTLSLDSFLPDSDPYMKISDEIKALAFDQYPYVPGANAEDPKNLIDTWFEFTPTGALDVIEGRTLDATG